MSASSEDPFAPKAIARDLAHLDRQEHLRTGSPGDLGAAQRIEDRLKPLGYTLERQPFDAPFFLPRKTDLSFDGGTVEVFPQHSVVVTGPAGIEAPLGIWRDESDTAAVAGAIAVVLLPRARHSQLLGLAVKAPFEAVLKGKPKAVVLITQGPTGDTIILNAPYDRPPADIPVTVLGPKPGKEAIQAARAGGKGRLVIDGEAGRRPSFNLIAHRPGKGPALVISTPRTGWTPAVAERGPGFAAFLALAQWAPHALPGTPLVLVSSTAHEFDNAGAEHFLKSGKAPKPSDTALWVHLGAGFAARGFHDLGNYTLLPLPSPDDQRFLVGSEALLPLLRQAFKGQAGLEQAYPAAAGAAGELREILAAGYAPAFGLFSGHPYHHSMNDRLDKTDPQWVAVAARAVRDVIRQVLKP